MVKEFSVILMKKTLNSLVEMPSITPICTENNWLILFAKIVKLSVLFWMGKSL